MKTTFDKKLLIEVLSIQSKSKNDKNMIEYLQKKIPSIAKNAIITKDDYGNIYVTKGKAKLYPCLVSHVDTIHKIHKDYKVYEQNGILFAFSATEGGQVGVGGDDKNGIFVCLSALKDLDNCKLVFFRDEEIGCLGSNKANMKFFDDCTIVAQADRRGHEGFVTKACSTELSSEEFQKHIDTILTNHHYKACNGSVTDVMTLKNKGLDVCTFNIECAYYNPHSDQEIVHIENLEDCYETIMEIIEATRDKRWIHKAEVKVKEIAPYRRYEYKNYGRHFQEGFDFDEVEWSPITSPRRDIIDHRALSDTNLLTDDPAKVNAYLNKHHEEKDNDNEFEDINEEELSEEIQLWEEVLICKKEYDSAIDDFQTHMEEKVERIGRI